MRHEKGALRATFWYFFFIFCLKIILKHLQSDERVTVLTVVRLLNIQYALKYEPGWNC